MQTKCPHCKRETTKESNPTWPFCSERCKMIDFGHWMNESYRVPVVEPDEEEGSELVRLLSEESPEESEP